jgi:N utilization substance protein B
VTGPEAGPAPATPHPSPRGKSPRPDRRLSREFAVQGLYEWLVAGHDLGVIDAHLRESDEFARCDRAWFDALLYGCAKDRAALDEHLARHGDRRPGELSPVEHAVLLIGVWELLNAVEIPYRVVINEGIELAKAFGGTDGHRYVNGVLDKAARDIRAAEVAAAPPRQPRPAPVGRGDAR